MYELTDKEHDAVLKLNAEYVEAHFKSKINEINGFYIIVDNNNGPILLEDQEQDEEGQLYNLIPVFCHATYANDYIKANLDTSYKAQFVSKDAYFKAWEQFAKDNKILFAIMPINDEFCVSDSLFTDTIA